MIRAMSVQTPWPISALKPQCGVSGIGSPELASNRGPWQRQMLVLHANKLLRNVAEFAELIVASR